VKKSRFSKAQIVAILREAEKGEMPVNELLPRARHRRERLLPLAAALRYLEVNEVRCLRMEYVLAHPQEAAAVERFGREAAMRGLNYRARGVRIARFLGELKSGRLHGPV